MITGIAGPPGARLTDRVNTPGARHIDPTIPSPARVYDALLGGKENYEADRALAARLAELSPMIGENARDNRAFGRRAVGFLMREHGIRRFLDIGSGLPTQENVHEVAHGIDPLARVVYVDNDPLAVAHARALLARDERVEAVEADLRSPDALLAAPQVAGLLAAGEPVGLLLLAVLHFIPDDADPYAIVRRLHDALPPGSFLVISHGTGDTGRERAAEVGDSYRASEPLAVRSRDDIRRFFDATELVPPGLVWTFDWRPDVVRTDPSPERKGIYAGVGRIPRPDAGRVPPS